ncbi:MAG: hypothetical protein HY646_05990 [Acidobacteria bacterium]|nr:hypothetical protein [Acidobacteriota bacterium]
MRELNMTNPTIKLDDGRLVYGCECWWGAPEKALQLGKEIRVVDIDAARADCRQR